MHSKVETQDFEIQNRPKLPHLNIFGNYRPDFLQEVRWKVLGPYFSLLFYIAEPLASTRAHSELLT